MGECSSKMTGGYLPLFQQNRWCIGEDFVHPAKYLHVVMSGHGANLFLSQFTSKVKKNTEHGQHVHCDVNTSMVQMKHDLEWMLD